MNIYVSASLFALLILIYWIISEIFTMLFRFIGLPEEKARFQVTSMLTGCGYTTRESEMLLSTRSRRRLTKAVILFGYVFNISVVSAFVNVFLSLKEAQFTSFFFGLLIPIISVVLLIVLIRIKPVRAAINHVIEKIAGSIVKSDSVNTVLLIDYIGKGSIAQITLKNVPEELAEKELAKSGLKERYHILVMLIESKDLKIEAPNAHTVFKPGDKLTVFGDYKTITHVFNAKERFE
ncbi:MAG: TrkA C-terminal domain-containing protein [Clostridiales bacterium]|nr:TrkA C-terminal domain-containing protein [Clostridiales bacterium]